MADTKGKPQTRFITLQGKSGWSHLDKPDTMYTPDGKWSQQIYLNDEGYTEVMKLKAEGMRNTIKKGDDGYNITFSRPTQKIFGGKWKMFEPPAIEKSDGTPLPRTHRFGHGSDISVTVEVYYTRPRPSAEYNANARLAGVRIDNEVPYSRADYTPEEQRVAKSLDKVPAAQSW